MILTKEKSAEMLEVAKPLIKFLNDNCHPHVKVIVEPDGAELVEGIAHVQTTQFIKD